MEKCIFTLAHQDREVLYLVKRSGFCIEQDRISLSIECKAENSEAFPPCYYLALDGIKFTHSLEPQSIKIRGNLIYEPPNVYVYATFHANDIEAEINIKSVTEQYIDVSVLVITEDPNYYDSQAKKTPFSGSCRIPLSNREDLWIPS